MILFISSKNLSSVILNKTSLKIGNDGPKVPKQAEAKWDGVINQCNYSLIKF